MAWPTKLASFCARSSCVSSTRSALGEMDSGLAPQSLLTIKGISYRKQVRNGGARRRRRVSPEGGLGSSAVPYYGGAPYVEGRGDGTYLSLILGTKHGEVVTYN